MNKELEGLVKYAKSQGYKVSFVGQKMLHDYAGMNPEAGKVMHWQIKPNEIEIDKHQSAATQTNNLRHEIIEAGLMKSGQSYEEAHLTALKLETIKLSPDELGALSKIGSYSVIHIHDDGDLTIKSKGIDYVVTTEGQVFKGTNKEATMPAVSEKQRRFAGAELGRLRAGKPTKTNMTEKQLEELAEKKDNAREEKTERKTMRRSGRLRISQRPPRITNRRMHIMR